MSTLDDQIKNYTKSIEYRKSIEQNFLKKNKKLIDDLENKKQAVLNLKNNHTNIRRN